MNTHHIRLEVSIPARYVTETATPAPITDSRNLSAAFSIGAWLPVVTDTIMTTDMVTPVSLTWSGRRRMWHMSAPTPRQSQAMASRLSQASEVLLICGRYEGVDERVAEHLADEEVSIGDYVLSGGELAAAVVVDAVARLIAGVLGNQDSRVFESFGCDGLLDCPHYTRPAEFRGWKVPDVLLNGNHADIRRWRREAALRKTARHRPDLMPAPIQDLLDKEVNDD